MLGSTVLSGIPDDVLSEVKRAVASGNVAEGEALLAAFQEEQFKCLESQGVELDSVELEVGINCKWSDILRQVFRVKDFHRGLTRIGDDGRPIAPSSIEPYGHLIVESPILNFSTRLPIIHRDDYLLAASVFDLPNYMDIIEGAELLVTYSPKWTMFGGRTMSTRHVLHYAVCPLGTLQRYYDFKQGIHMRHPNPERLLGKFIYHGEVKVNLIENPIVG